MLKTILYPWNKDNINNLNDIKFIEFNYENNNDELSLLLANNCFIYSNMKIFDTLQKMVINIYQ